MAFGGGAGKGRPNSNINVTPLVDVVLVLLIIFLVAMPVVMRDITIDVPKKSEDKDVVPSMDQIMVEVKKSGLDGSGNVQFLELNTIQVTRIELATKLQDRLEHSREKIVFVDFDESTRYGEAVSIMDTCKGAGAKSVALKMKGLKDESGDAPPASPLDK